jgi:hypothetical protein
LLGFRYDMGSLEGNTGEKREEKKSEKSKGPLDAL